jgi:hypothetical protein
MKDDQKENKKHDKELTLKIETTQGTWEHTFDKTDKVQEVLQAVIGHFNYAPDGHYELRLAREPNNALKPERTLVSYGIENGEVLVFTDLGVAV